MREIYLSGYNNFIIPFMLGMIFVLCWCVIGAIRIIMQLTAEDRKKALFALVNPKIMLKNIKDWFCDCLFHVKLWKRNKLLGYMHTSIAFGWFMLIVIGHIEVFLYTPERVHKIWYPIFFRYFVAVTDSTMKGSFFFFLMDFFLLVVLSGIILAIVKRARSRFFGMRRTTRSSITDLIGLYSLWCIFPLRLLAEGFTADISGGSFLTKSLNWVLNSFLNDQMNMLPTWWAYSIALGIFMCVLPFSRYMHIPAEILLIYLRNAGISISHPRKGYAKIQVYSCPGCGVCIDACPMGVSKANTKDTTVYLNRQIKRKNECRIDEISDKCLLCGKCTAVCPVGVEGDKIRIAQRSARRYNITPSYANISTEYLKSMVNKNVTNINNSVKSADNKHVLYFSGCMTSLTPGISKSVISILEKAGVRCDFMDKEGGLCCGRPMWMTGRIDEAKELIARNTEIIKASAATVLLVSCPICYKVFKEEYRLEGIRVVHHTEYFNELLSEGRIRIEKNEMRLVYHDPCELGRGCGIYEEPRRLVASAGNMIEAKKNRKESICCGGSLGSISLSNEKRKPIIENAISNLAAESPDTIVTACPLCKSTFARHSRIPVKDIAEIIDNQMTTN